MTAASSFGMRYLCDNDYRLSSLHRLMDRGKVVGERNHPKDTGRDGAAFLLAQLGAHAASKFAARIQSLDLTPALVGVLRFLARNPGSSQRELADAIGMRASRLVAMADELERRELVMRVRDERDRRSHRITLTGAGKAQLEAI